MSFNEEEKGLLAEAVQVYMQLVSRQMPPQHVEQMAEIAQSVLSKIANSDSLAQGDNKPAGISDEWYENVCSTCNKLSASGCTDKVTAKFPGKCDPILHYEKKKILEGK